MSLITPRDLSLFRELGKYGLLTTSQLAGHVFPGVQSSTVLRRLRALEKAKWIYRVKALESGELVWILSRDGENKIGLEIPMIKPNRNGVAHDVLLTEFRMALESVGLGQNFIPEWVVRRQTYNPGRRRSDDGTLVPDGIFVANLWNKNLSTVAIELEIHAKNISRYEKIFSKYMGQSKLDLVWYFVKTKSFGESLFAKWKEVQKRRYNRDENLIFTIISDFEKNPRQAQIYFMSGGSNRVKEFFILPRASDLGNMPAQPVGRGDAPETEAEELKLAC